MQDGARIGADDRGASSPRTTMCGRRRPHRHPGIFSPRRSSPQCLPSLSPSSLLWPQARRQGQSSIGFSRRPRRRERASKCLRALRAQLIALPRVNTHNKTATDKSAPPMHLLPITYPTTPFETAVFSENGISVRDETISAATDYLLKAWELNAAVVALQGAHLANQHANIKVPTQTFLFDQADKEMPPRIQSLTDQIEMELRIRKRSKKARPTTQRG